MDVERHVYEYIGKKLKKYMPFCDVRRCFWCDTKQMVSPVSMGLYCMIQVCVWDIFVFTLFRFIASNGTATPDKDRRRVPKNPPTLRNVNKSFAPPCRSPIHIPPVLLLPQQSLNEAHLIHIVLYLSKTTRAQTAFVPPPLHTAPSSPTSTRSKSSFIVPLPLTLRHGQPQVTG